MLVRNLEELNSYLEGYKVTDTFFAYTINRLGRFYVAGTENKDNLILSGVKAKILSVDDLREIFVFKDFDDAYTIIALNN